MKLSGPINLALVLVLTDSSNLSWLGSTLRPGVLNAVSLIVVLVKEMIKDVNENGVVADLSMMALATKEAIVLLGGGRWENL
jgi:hypothetical protein